MTWADAWVVAVRGIRRRFSRAVLTVAAVALAAALLTSLLIAVGAARNRVFSAVSKGGPLTGIQVLPNAPDFGQLDSDSAKPAEPRPIDDSVRRRIQGLRGVTSVVPLLSTGVFVVPSPPKQAKAGSGAARAPDPFRGTLTGVDLGRAEQLPVTVLAGVLPAPGALDEIAVTDAYLRKLGLRSTQSSSVIGTQVELGAPRVFSDGNRDVTVRGQWSKATIVSVVAAQGTSGQLIGSLAVVRAARAWTAASDTTGRSGTDQFVREVIGDSQYSGLFVVTAGFDSVGTVRESITRIGFSSSAPESLIASVRRYSTVVEIVLTAIGLIALTIAALGIANAMLAAVRERRREIGVLKAIGARDRDVRRVFLLEAALLGLVGGAVGTALGYALARLVGLAVNRYLHQQGLTGVAIGLPIGIITVGILGSGALALVAGTIPAQRAAQLPARRAMGDA
ncbi:MAG TPA: FtsX-like permease family protein [Acidimicrobiia bacterium]|jgi:ABC-type antimicrobial peptide transport system permease subunit